MKFSWIPEFDNYVEPQMYAAKVPRRFENGKFWLTNDPNEALMFDSEKECQEWIDQRKLDDFFVPVEHGFGP